MKIMLLIFVTACIALIFFFFLERGLAKFFEVWRSATKNACSSATVCKKKNLAGLEPLYSAVSTTRCISRTQLATVIILVLLDAQSSAGVPFAIFESENFFTKIFQKTSFFSKKAKKSQKFFYLIFFLFLCILVNSR
jgi:preprotein translocase subunit SecG